MALLSAIAAIGSAIGGAVAAVSGFIGGLGAIGSFVLQAAVGIGMSLLSQAIAGKPKDPTFSINGTLRAGGDVPRSFILGRTATAGSLVWANTWGKDGETDNAYLTQVIALSDLPITSIESIEVNGENCPLDPTLLVQSSGDGNALGVWALTQFKDAFGIVDDFLFKIGREAEGNKIEFIFDWLIDKIENDGGGTAVLNFEQTEMGFPVPAYRKDGKDNLWLKFYDGNQTAVDEFLRVKASSGQRDWSHTRIGKGVAYAIVTSRVSGNMFSGIPSFKFVVNGIPLYDISKDSTAGGDGDHRWSDPSTWGGDGDHLPAVQAYNLLRGLQFDGEWFYGVQGLSTTPARLPAANWIAAIEKCRATVTGDDGPEPAYRSAGEITVDAPLANALEAINTTCQGRISEVGGIYSMFLGSPDDASFTFTDGDILSTEEQTFTPFFGLADTINGVFANYPSPDDGWGMKSAPPIYRTDLEAKHGNRRLMADVELTFVPYPEQVQRLMKQALLEGQRARRHTMVLPPKFWPYAVPGATCSLTSERNGYVTKLFRVDGVSDRANLDVMVDITEVDPAAYDWDTEDDYTPPTDGVVGPLRPQPQPIVDFFAEGDTVVGSGDKIRPAIRLEWDGDKVDIAGVEFQVRLAATAEVVHVSRTDDFAAGAIKISNNLFSNTVYGVRARYIPASPRDTLWSDWLAVTTPDVRLTDVSAALGNMTPGVKAMFSGLITDQNTIRAEMERIALNGSEAIGAINSQSAVSQRFRDAMAVSLLGKKATISETAAGLKALAELTAAVSAQVGPNEASGLFQITAEATPDDAQARLGISMRAEANGAVKTAAMLMDALASGEARIGFYADRFFFMVGGTLIGMFDEDGLKFNNALIANLDATNITAAKLDAAEILQDGTLITDLMAFGAVTEYTPISYSWASGVQGGVVTFDEGAWTHHGTFYVDNPAATPVIEFIKLTAFASLSGSGSRDAYIALVRNGSSTFGTGTLVGSARALTNTTTTFNVTNFRDEGETTIRYDIWTWNTYAAGGGSSVSISVACGSGALFWKR